MAWYRITYHPRVLQDLSGVDRSLAQRLLDKTKWIASNAGNLRHEPLDGALPGLSKYTVGDWCLVYSLDQADHVVCVHLIGPRADLYPGPCPKPAPAGRPRSTPVSE